jgi:hypothetical protein
MVLAVLVCCRLVCWLGVRIGAAGGEGASEPALAVVPYRILAGGVSLSDSMSVSSFMTLRDVDVGINELSLGDGTGGVLLASCG